MHTTPMPSKLIAGAYQNSYDEYCAIGYLAHCAGFEPYKIPYPKGAFAEVRDYYDLPDEDLSELLRLNDSCAPEDRLAIFIDFCTNHGIALEETH